MKDSEIAASAEMRARAIQAAMPVARAGLRETSVYRSLAGGGGARSWLERKSRIASEAMAKASLDELDRHLGRH